MDEQILSLKESLRVVLRYGRVAAVIALVGLLLGIAYGVSQPALASAKSEVLLPASAGNSSSGVPTQGIATEVEIAMSPGILNPAAKKAGISLPVRDPGTPSDRHGGNSHSSSDRCEVLFRGPGRAFGQ